MNTKRPLAARDELLTIARHTADKLYPDSAAKSDAAVALAMAIHDGETALGTATALGQALGILLPEDPRTELHAIGFILGTLGVTPADMQILAGGFVDGCKDTD